jgi:hypothetical protein
VTRRVTRALGLAIGVVTGGLTLAAVILLVATRDAPLPDSWGFRGAQALAAAVCGSVGFVIATRRPDNRIGWILGAMGLCFGIEAAIEAYAIASTQVPGPLPGMPGIAWFLTWIWVPAVSLALVGLPLLFPTGQLLSPRWRPVAWLGLVGTVLVVLAVAVTPGPIQQATYIDNPVALSVVDRPTSNALTGASMLLVIVASGFAIASLIRRYRSAGDIVRRQIRWFAFSAAVAGPVFCVYVLTYVLDAPPAIQKAATVADIVSILAMPIAAGLAVLRYRLYEIDRIISRTISYGLVTGVLIGTYGLVILVLQGPLQSVTGGDTLAVALSTLVAAALFQPLRTRVQRAVDRRFDRARIDAERTSASFAERLRDEVDIAAVTSDLRGTVGASLKPDGLGLWLREPGR